MTGAAKAGRLSIMAAHQTHWQDVTQVFQGWFKDAAEYNLHPTANYNSLYTTAHAEIKKKNLKRLFSALIL